MKEQISSDGKQYLFIGKAWELRQLIENRRIMREEALKP